MKTFKKIAHRGYSAEYPENTLKAFDEAINAGADMIELDIHLTSDGEIVVIHDDYIDRTSNGSGKVKDMTLDALKKFNYSYTFKGENEIPLLSEVIELVKGRAEINIEIKNLPLQYLLIEEKVIALLKKMNFSDKVIVSSFDHHSLLKVKELSPSIRRGILYDAVWLTFEQEIEFLQPFSIHPNVDVFFKQDFDFATKNGIKIYPWVAKDKATVDFFKQFDAVDGIMVNDLKIFE